MLTEYPRNSFSAIPAIQQAADDVTSQPVIVEGAKTEITDDFETRTVCQAPLSVPFVYFYYPHDIHMHAKVNGQ